MGISFAVACKTFFGLPGEALKEFHQGYRALTPEDKLEIHAGFVKLGMDVDLPPSSNN